MNNKNNITWLEKKKRGFRVMTREKLLHDIQHQTNKAFLVDALKQWNKEPFCLGLVAYVGRALKAYFETLV